MLPRNIKKLPISQSIIEHFLSKGIKHFKISNPLPDDAKVISVLSDWRAIPLFYFIIQSKEYPELNEGDEIPLVEMLGFVDLRSVHE